MAGGAIFVYSACRLNYNSLSPLEVIFFFAVVVIAECAPVLLPASYMSMYVTASIILALFLTHGLALTVVICMISVPAGGLFAQRAQPMRWLLPFAVCNASSEAIAFTLASLGYLYCGGQALTNASIGQLDWALVGYLIIWVLIFEAVIVVTNLTFSLLYSGQSWRLSLQHSVKWSAMEAITMIPFSILFVSLYMAYHVYGMLLALIPLFTLRRVLCVYAKYIRAYLGTISALGLCIQHHHLYTRGHLERVADLSDRIATHMDMPVRTLTYIREAGLLHDIGKVGIDESTLDKVGKLTDEEWQAIKQHPVRGAEILSQMKHFRPIVSWVRGHHERPDGTGYPDGLRDI